MIGASTSPTDFPNVYFQCDGAGNPIPSNPDGSQAQGIPCNKIPSGLINNIGQAMMNLYPAPNASNSSAGYNYVNQPVRTLDDTKFDARLDYTLSSKDNLFGRFSYDQAFSYVPGGSPGFAEANAFGSNQHIINHAPQRRPRRDPCVLPHDDQPGQLSVTTASSTTSLRKARGPAPPPLSCPAAFPTPTWDAPVPPAFPAHTVADWSPRSSPAAIGPSAIAATLRSRAERISISFKDSLDLIRHKHEFRSGTRFPRQSDERGH